MSVPLCLPVLPLLFPWSPAGHCTHLSILPRVLSIPSVEDHCPPTRRCVHLAALVVDVGHPIPAMLVAHSRVAYWLPHLLVATVSSF